MTCRSSSKSILSSDFYMGNIDFNVNTPVDLCLTQ